MELNLKSERVMHKLKRQNNCSTLSRNVETSIETASCRGLGFKAYERCLLANQHGR